MSDTIRNTAQNVVIQGIGSGVEAVNQARFYEWAKNLCMQQINLDGALDELQMARDFLGDPEHILGSLGTKHGEVAEVLEVRFGNADRIIRGEDPNYSFDGVGRTAAEDYLKNNLPVQSKFVQSNLSMDAVLKHLDKYPDFVNNGGTYCIPKDYYEQIEMWRKMSEGELSKLPAADGGKLARKVMDKINELEEKTGIPFEDMVEPSQVKYNEVQLKRASDTINGKEAEIIEVDNKRREEYWKLAQASVAEGFKVAGISAAISGVLTFVTKLTGVLKGQKKKISELNSEDWKQIFKETGIGAVKGGVSGGAIYALTNAANMSAPLAAALVSATLGMASQAVKLYKKEISFDDFMYNTVDVTVEAAASGAGALVGQALIPVPVLGAIIGSLVFSTALTLTKKYLFDGGYYEIVKRASYEKEFSDQYEPLAVAFDRCSQVFELANRQYNSNMKQFRDNRNDGGADLDKTLCDIINS